MLKVIEIIHIYGIQRHEDEEIFDYAVYWFGVMVTTMEILRRGKQYKP